MAEELLSGTDGKKTIAVVSAPSVFVQLRNILVCCFLIMRDLELTVGKADSGKEADEKPKLYLLEFDRRFEVFPEFVFYDFNNPLNLPRMCGPSSWSNKAC